MNSWVNGRRAGVIGIRDRGLNYGDGAFETMRVRRRAIRLLDFHLERLADACARLAIHGLKPALLRRELERVAARAPEAVIKLVVTRGVGPRGYRPSGAERCNRIISSHRLPRAAPLAAPRAVRVRLCAMRLGTNAALAGMKTLNRLECVLARAEWSDPRVWEGLMRDMDDHIVCGTMSNLFLRIGSRLSTPRLDRCGVAGVMRRWVLAQAGGIGLQPREARLCWDDLRGADEAFLTNAVAGIVPVAVFEHGRERARPPEHDVAHRLAQRLELL